MGKYRALMERLSRTGLATGANLRTTAPALARWLDLAHDPAYVDQVLSCAVPEADRARDRLPGRRARLAARAARHGRDAAGGAAGAGTRHRLQHGRRQPPRPAGPGCGLLHVERRGRGRIGPRERGLRRADPGARPRRPPGRRHGRHLRRRRPRLHLLAARRAQLPGAQDRLRPRHRPARRHRRRGLSGDAAHRTRHAGRASPPGPRLLQCRRRPAPRRPARADGAERRRPARARPHRDRPFPHARRPVCGVIGGGYSSDIEALAGRHAILFEVADEFA